MTPLMFATVTQSGADPVIKILGIGLSGVKDYTTVSLFHTYKKSDVKTKKRMAGVIELNESLYGRKTVIDRLGGLIKTKICEIY